MIKVDTQCMATQAQQMQRIADELNKIASSVASVNRTLSWNTSVNALVRASLTTSKLKVAQLDDKAKKLGNALNNSASKYEEAEGKAKKGEYENGPRSVTDILKDVIEGLDLNPDGATVDSVLEYLIEQLQKTVDPKTKYELMQKIVDLYDVAKEKGIAGVEWLWEKISGYDLDTEIYETVVEDILFKALGIDDIDDVAKIANQVENIVNDITNGNVDGETVSDFCAVVMEGLKVVGESPFTPVEVKIVKNTVGLLEEYSNKIGEYEDAAAQAILDGNYMDAAANIGKAFVTEFVKGPTEVIVKTVGDVFMLEEVGAVASMITGYDIPGAFSDFGSKIEDGFDKLFGL